MLTFGSLFAGIGGFDLGFERAGMKCLWQVEKDPFCQKVLAKHWPNVPKYDDVLTVGSDNLETVDVICGGFPCQPHSYAGKRKASRDDRDLWGEFARIISEIKPGWVVAENVPGLLSSENGRYFGRVLRDLAQMGYDAEWGSITASSFGVHHIRERVILLAYPNIGNAQKNGTIFDQTVPIPKAWTLVKYDRLFNTAWYDLKPDIGDRRSGNGVPDQLDRLRSLGNAVVPQVAEFVGSLIVEANKVCVKPE